MMDIIIICMLFVCKQEPYASGGLWEIGNANELTIGYYINNNIG